jgi:hypothetical protein
MPLPTVRATLAAPEPLLKIRSFLRLHNRAAKDALREEGERHHKERIPGHFKRSAASKYGYKRRKPSYMRFKARRFRSVLDLVKSGATRQAMINNQPKYRAGGKAADDEGNSAGLRLTIELQFPFGKAAQQSVAKARRLGRRTTRGEGNTAGVTIRQMRAEIGAITQDEGRDTARGFIRGYGRKLAVGLARSPRIRKQVKNRS